MEQIKEYSVAVIIIGEFIFYDFFFEEMRTCFIKYGLSPTDYMPSRNNKMGHTDPTQSTNKHDSKYNNYQLASKRKQSNNKHLQ